MPASSYFGRSGIVDKKGNIVAVTSAQTFLGGFLISASSCICRGGIVDKKGNNIVAGTSAQTSLGGLFISASSYYGRSGIVDKKGNIVAVTNRPGVCGVGPGPRGCKSTRDDRSPTFGPSVSTGTDPHRPGRRALSPGVSGEGSSLRGCKRTRGDRSPTFGSHVPVGTDPHRLGVCFHAGHSISDGTVRKPLSVAFGGCCSATACPDLHRVVISIVYLYVCLLCDGLVLLLNWPVHTAPAPAFHGHHAAQCADGQITFFWMSAETVAED